MAGSFLQPFWAWTVARATKGCPSKVAHHLCLLFLAIFDKQFIHPSPYTAHSRCWGASGASVSSTGQACIGGWMIDSMSPSKSNVHWFQQLGGPCSPSLGIQRWRARRGAALEMLGSLARRDTALLGKSKEFPSSAFRMQIVFLLYHAGAHLCPSHRKTDFDQWADELAHPYPQGLTHHLQLDFS